MDTWKQWDTEEFPNHWVSCTGRVKKVSPRTGREFIYKLRYPTNKGCSTEDKAYSQVIIQQHGTRAYLYVHRLVARAFLPNPDNFPVVNHRDSDRHNNNVSNLEWTTYQHNQRHAMEKGAWTPPRGSRNGMAKLTEEQVVELRTNLKKHDTQGRKVYAEKFGVKEATIRHALLDQWKHIAITPKEADQKGPRNPASKLTLEQVEEIRRTYKKGVRGFGYQSLAKKYGVCQTNIANIVNGVFWQNVQP